MTDNPVLDAARHISDITAYSDALDAEVESLKFSLLAALTVGDMEDKAHFLPQPVGKSKPTIGEVWAEALEMSLDNKSKVELAQLLRDVALGKQVEPERAKALLVDAAQEYGRFYAEVTVE